MSEAKKAAKAAAKAEKKAEKEKIAKMSKAEKKEYKKQKKQEKNTPEVIDFKQNLFKAITAVVCVAILSVTVSGAVDSYCEAVKLEGQATAKEAEEAAQQVNAAPQNNTAAPAADNGSYAAPVDNGTPADVPAGDDATATTPTDDATATTPAGDTTNTGAPAANGGTKIDPNAKSLTSNDAAAVVAFYNKAVKATKDNAPKGQSTMKLDGGITGDGALGTVLKVASPVIESTLQRNSTATDYIPGNEADLLATDVTRAAASSKNGVTTIAIQLKTQKDGPQADAHTAGPVARGIGTLGNVDNAINELGAEVSKGKDTIVLNYTDAYIKCTVDEKTGKITSGTWHYKVNVTVGDAAIKLVVSFNAKNLKAVIDYTVVI